MSRRATRASQRSSLARGEERTRTRGVPLALTRHEERTRDMNYAIAQHGLDWRWHTTLQQPHRATARTFYSWRHNLPSEQRGVGRTSWYHCCLPGQPCLNKKLTSYSHSPYWCQRCLSDQSRLIYLRIISPLFTRCEMKWGRWNGKCQKEVARFVRSLRQHKRSIEVNPQCFCSSSLLLTWNVLTRVQVRAWMRVDVTL